MIINYGRQNIDSAEIQAVIKVLKSEYLTQGPRITQFENLLNKKFGSKHCTVVSNGTAALHLTGLALGWKKDDIVLTSPNTFLATVNSIVYNGATPEFVDICKETYCIDPNLLEDKIIKLKKIGKKIHSIIGVDYAGHPCDWESIKYLSNKHSIVLINDNCHAIGASINKNKKYAIKYADIVTHSYHPVKNITCGEGGAILTNNSLLDNRIKILRNHGINKKYKQETKKGRWFYEMNDLGFNYRLSDIHCAIGIVQLKKLNKFIEARKKVAKYYDRFFTEINDFKIPKVKKNFGHAYHLYPLIYKFKKNNKNKKNFFNYLNKNNINLQVHYFPVHLQPFYKKNFGFDKGHCPIAENFYNDVFSMPIYPSLTVKLMKYVVNRISKYLIA